MIESPQTEPLTDEEPFACEKWADGVARTPPAIILQRAVMELVKLRADSASRAADQEMLVSNA